MAQPIIIALPPGLVLSDGDQILVSAVNPANGADVGGVKVQAISFDVDNHGTADLSSGAFVPLLRPV